MDSFMALERSYAHLLAAATGISGQDLARPSQCAGWDIRTLLNHTLGTGWMFTLVNQGQAADEDAGDLVGDDPSGALAELAEANVGAWQSPHSLEGDRVYPFGTYPAQAALALNVGEIAVHAWDLATSTGKDATIDPGVARLLLDFYATLPLDLYRQHGAFGPEVPVSADAPVAARMLGLIGFSAS